MKEKAKTKKTKKTIPKKARKIKKSKKPQFRFNKPKVDKRAFIAIAILLFTISTAFLVFGKDKSSEGVIQYTFFSLIIYLIWAILEKIREKS